MNDKEEWQSALQEMKILDETDVIEEEVMANWCQMSMSQTKGSCFFTNKKFLFVSLFGLHNFSIDYRDIKKIGKCRAGILPIGMYVVAENKEEEKIEKFKISVRRRDKCLKLLSVKSGVNIG